MPHKLSKKYSVCPKTSVVRCSIARHQPNAETLEAMREPTDDLPRVETVEDLLKELQD
jgi:hypothetical protein